MAFSEVGIQIEFKGSGPDETGVVTVMSSNVLPLSIGQEVVRIDREYFRPAEVDTLIGDASKAKAKLGWEPKVSLQELVAEMVAIDLRKI
jgi:GDPmannose 4,6-dehydratase